MNVGDEVKTRLEYGMQGHLQEPVETGTVVYMHPEGRYYTAEFAFEKGTVRESFLIMDPERVVDEPRLYPGMPGYKQGPRVGGHNMSRNGGGRHV